MCLLRIRHSRMLHSCNLIRTEHHLTTFNWSCITSIEILCLLRWNAEKLAPLRLDQSITTVVFDDEIKDHLPTVVNIRKLDAFSTVRHRASFSFRWRWCAVIDVGIHSILGAMTSSIIKVEIYGTQW